MYKHFELGVRKVELVKWNSSRMFIDSMWPGVENIEEVHPRDSTVLPKGRQVSLQLVRKENHTTPPTFLIRELIELWYVFWSIEENIDTAILIQWKSGCDAKWGWSQEKQELAAPVSQSIPSSYVTEKSTHSADKESTASYKFVYLAGVWREQLLQHAIGKNFIRIKLHASFIVRINGEPFLQPFLQILELIFVLRNLQTLFQVMFRRIQYSIIRTTSLFLKKTMIACTTKLGPALCLQFNSNVID